MTCELIPVELTDEQKGQVCGILSVGCDRQTAADFVGCLLADIRRGMQHDLLFQASVRRAESGVELSHMRSIQEAGCNKKDWRASVWWLERRSPERYAKRGPGVVTTRQLKAFVAILTDMLSEVIHDANDRQRLRDRLLSIAETMDQILRDAGADTGETAANPLSTELFEDDLPADEGCDDADDESWS